MRSHIHVSLTSQQTCIRLRRRFLLQAVRQCAIHYTPRANLSLVYVDNRTIRRLNRRFLGYSHTTDVLAFPLSDSIKDLDGEIIVSAQLARQEAVHRKIPLHQELLLYTLHGLLHLVGFDHGRKTEALCMRDEEIRLMRTFFPEYPR